jgi:uncharacterized protein involved in outer membrane biogenesis
LRKVAIGVVAVLVLVVAGLLVAPSFIDWNRYRPMIAQKIGEATGREVTLAGPLSVALLPAPTVTARDVRIANPPGAAEPDMVRLAALDVRLAVLPLLSGSIVATSVALDSPAIDLEKFPDGRNNWTFAKAEAAPPAGQPSPPAPAPSPPPTAAPEPARKSGEVALSIERLTIRNGTVVYRAPGAVERVEKLDVTGRIEGVSGPYSAKGSLVFHNAKLAFDADVSRLGERTPARAALEFGGARAALDGEILDGGGRRSLTGKLKLAAADLGAALESAGATAPAWLAGRKAGLEARLDASPERVALGDLALSLDEARASGSAAVALGAVPDATIKLAISQLDLDKLAASGRAPAKTPPAQVPAGAPAPAQPPANAAAPSPSPAAATTGFALPSGLRATVDIGAEAVVWRGAVIRQTRLQASLADGTATINRLAALLPGGSDVSFSGTTTSGPAGLALAGDVEAESDNLRGLLEWLGVPPGDVPADRLRKASLAAHLTAMPERIDVAGLDLSVDASRLTGAATVALRGRPGVGARLVLDRLNLDAYLPQPAAAPAQTAGAAAPPAQTPPPQVVAAPRAASPLGRIDGNLDLSVGRLTWRGQAIEALHFAGALQSGDLTIREASVKDLAGSALTASGLVREIAAERPQLQLAFEARGQALERTARVLVPSLASLPPLGPYTVSGEAQGDADALAFEGDLAVAGGKLHAAGERHAAPPSSVTVELSHPETARLIATLAPSYKPAAGTLGPLAATARVALGAEETRVAEIDASVGRTGLKGNLALSTGGLRPKLAGELAFTTLPLDRFLPARQAALSGTPALPPGFLFAQAGAGAPRGGESPRWSREKLDLSALGLVDADLKLTGDALSYGKWELAKPDIALHLKDAVLGIERLAGGIFGGSVKLDGEVSGAAAPAMKLAVQLRDADVKDALRVAAGVDRVDGRADLDVALHTAGASQAELVSHVDGDGKLDTRDGVITGIDLKAISDRLKDLGRVTDLLDLARTGTRGETRFSRLSGTFKAQGGVLRSDDLRLQAEAAEGEATAMVDLPRWMLQCRVAFRLTEHPNAPPLAMTLDGPLDNPRKVVDINALQGFLTQRLLGGRGAAPPSDTGAPPAPSEPQKPERMLRDLLKGLGR